MSDILDKHNQMVNAFNGMETLLSGHREEVPKIAPPIEPQQNQQANNGYPPQNPYGGYPPGYGHQPPYQPNPYGGYPPQNMRSPFTQLKTDFDEELLETHAKQRIKQSKLEDKFYTVIPNEILRVIYDRRKDKILIAEFERSDEDRADLDEESEILKAYDRQEKVKKLDDLIKANDNTNDDEYILKIAIAQFKHDHEMGILELPTYDNYWSLRRKGYVLDYNEFISDAVTAVANQVGGKTEDFMQTVKSMLFGRE